MYDVEEAIARFFPRGTGYDRKQAKRMIEWLDRCGYMVAPKCGAQRETGPQPQPKKKFA